MKTAAYIGLSLREFWELTPFEFSLLVDAYIQKFEQEAEEKIILTYANALWTAQWLFGKTKPPKLEKLLNKKRKKMTPEEMLAEVKRLNAMFGGKIRYEGKEGKINGD